MTGQQLPEGWRMVKFGDIAKHVSKRVEPSETELDIYVGLEHLDPDSLKITRYGVPSDVAGQKLLVKKGQIIFGKRRAYQRKVAVADWDCICSAHAMVLEANPDSVIPGFLPFFMQSDIFMNRAVAISEGSLSPTIKWKVLASQEFCIPNVDKQLLLLRLFLKLDGLEALYSSALRAGEKLLSSIFKGEVKLSLGDLNGLRESNVMLKKGWSVLELSSVCDIFSGGTPSRKNPDFWNGDIPWIKTAEIDYKDIYSAEEKITSLGLRSSSAKVAPAGSVLLAMYGQGVTRGRVAILKTDAAMNQACLCINASSKEKNRYIYHYLKHCYYDLREFGNETTQKNLSSGIVKKLKIPFPVAEQLAGIVDALDDFERNTNALQFSIERHKELKAVVLSQEFCKSYV
ncbi:restriction endonuclease subunit S [Pseudomonas fragi]|uniref:restriction endonuclease subunit S n=1 Tax=Pseudomonas fragi TaxID=296 RepID=UPI0021BECEED|nr:restriction endonuclease subunit S [Pseudomonas fragi]UXL37982.1 restriction endonuclease subunit S [Pseudomonas fragi]